MVEAEEVFAVEGEDVVKVEEAAISYFRNLEETLVINTMGLVFHI